MNDPIEEVLNQLRRKPGVQRGRFSSSFLNKVADVFEREGFATTELFLRDKMEQDTTRRQARVILEDVIPVLKACERIRQNRTVGRLVIKSLETMQSKEGGRRR